MSKNILEQIGLSEEQAKIYDCLIKNGSLPARRIGILSGVNRSLVYKVVKKLIDFGLVSEEKIPTKPSKFMALNPSRLEHFIEQKEKDLKIANQAFSEAISVLGSQFNLTCNKPTVRFAEGIRGLKILYKDINLTGKDIKLIRSPFDKQTSELEILVNNQVKSQIEKGIHTRVIAPMNTPYSDALKKRDEMHLITRCAVPKEEMNITAQIIIYGEKVAFTSFENCMLTTIVEDKSIAGSFAILFEAMWKKYSPK